MKLEGLLRHLRRNGCVLRREGKEHSLWENPQTGHAEAVPRQVASAQETRMPADKRNEEKMGSISNSLSGLSCLTQPGGLFSNLPAPISAADLKSASPQDIVSLSIASLQTQEVNDLFGGSQGNQNAAPLIPLATPQAANALLGVSAADLANATPQEQAAINDQALLLQQVQGLFAAPAPATGTTNVFG